MIKTKNQEMINTGIYKIIIPKNTILYRKAKNNEIESCMFFSFDTWGVDTNTDNLYDAPIQVWKTNVEIVTSLLVTGVCPSGRYKTSIDKYYDEFFGENELCVGQIKSRTNENRAKFLSWLNNNLKIESWVTTIDDNSEMMVFFSFAFEISRKVDFVKYIETKAYINSFKEEMIVDEVPEIECASPGFI